MNNDLNNMAKRYKDEMMSLYRRSGQKSGIMGMGAGMSGNASNSQMSQSANDRMEMQMQDFAEAAAGRAAGDQTNQTGQTRDAAGTPVPGVPGASFYSNTGNMSCGSGNNQTSDMTGSTTGNAQPMNPTGNVQPQPVTPAPGNTANSTCNAAAPVNVNVPMECQCRFPTAESIIGSMGNPGNTGNMNNTVNPGSQIQPRIANNVMTANMDAPTAAAFSGNEPGIAALTADVPAADTSAEADNGSGLRSIIINSFPATAEYVANDPGETTGEIYPDFAMPADIPAEASEDVPQTAHFFPSIGWITITGGDNAWGYLQVEVFDQRGNPIQGASVVVKKRVNGIVRLMRFLYTNWNGRTPTIALPAPAIMTLTAQSATPFSIYEITVRARGFFTIRNIQVPIYAGSKLSQPIEMRSIYPDTIIQPRTTDVG